MSPSRISEMRNAVKSRWPNAMPLTTEFIRDIMLRATYLFSKCIYFISSLTLTFLDEAKEYY